MAMPAISDVVTHDEASVAASGGAISSIRENPAADEGAKAKPLSAMSGKSAANEPARGSGAKHSAIARHVLGYRRAAGSAR
jgi:hypothetical protein